MVVTVIPEGSQILAALVVTRRVSRKGKKQLKRSTIYYGNINKVVVYCLVLFDHILLTLTKQNMSIFIFYMDFFICG